MDNRALDRADAMSHVLRLEVLTVLFRGQASAAEVAAALDVPVDKIRYQLRRLREQGFIDEVAGRQRRGTVERFYVTLDREVVVQRDELAELPEEVRRSLDAHLLKVIFRESLRALTAGTMSARDDAATVRFPMSVDAQGWSELAALQVEVFERMQTVKDESQTRLRASGEEPIHASSVLMLFEQPPP
jgi:DNA-binding transcriptional ArsR family regulator